MSNDKVNEVKSKIKDWRSMTPKSTTKMSEYINREGVERILAEEYGSINENEDIVLATPVI